MRAYIVTVCIHTDTSTHLNTPTRTCPCRPLRDLISTLSINRRGGGIIMYSMLCKREYLEQISQIVCEVAQGENKNARHKFGSATSGIWRPTSTARPKAESISPMWLFVHADPAVVHRHLRIDTSSYMLG